MVGAPAVNVVNALHLARQRGIAVNRTRVELAGALPDLLEVRVVAGGLAVRVAGAPLGAGYLRVTEIHGFRVNVAPEGHLIVLRNRDVPGVIGRVGTLLGDAGINIAEYHQARLSAGGEALAVVGVDAALKPEHVAALARLPEVHAVAQVAFP